MPFWSRSRPIRQPFKILHRLHWLPIVARIEYKICLLTHKALITEQPAYLNELLIRYNPSYEIKLRAADEPGRLVVPFLESHATYAARAFSYAAPKIYNSLPTTLRGINNLDTFKSKLKTYFFSVAYDPDDHGLMPGYKL